MKDLDISICEANLLIDAVRNEMRLDGRKLDEMRQFELHFGSNYGCAYVALGETKAIAQVSCELAEPRSIRPNEGNLFVNLEINEMVCGNFETGHRSHLSVHANRLLEKCIKDSRCIDLESLCIISGEHVWEIKIDISVLNYDGNLHTCCSLAALAALAHFKTPHVTVENSEVKIHSVYEHEPEGLSMHHFPILISYAVFCDGEYVLLDPNELEEKLSEAELVFGMNSYRELCGLHFRGNAIGNRNLVLSCASRASQLAMSLVGQVKELLEAEKKLREAGRGRTVGLCDSIHLDRILSACQDRNSLKLVQEEVKKIQRDLDNEMNVDIEANPDFEDERAVDENDENNEPNMKDFVFSESKVRGVILQPIESSGISKNWTPSGNENAWELPSAVVDEEDSSSTNSDEVDYVKTLTIEDRIVDKIELSGESEEEEVPILESKDME